MPIVNLRQAAVSQRLYQPLHDHLPHCDATRACPALPDVVWLQLGLAWVLHECKSGRAFLQEFGHRLEGRRVSTLRTSRRPLRNKEQKPKSHRSADWRLGARRRDRRNP